MKVIFMILFLIWGMVSAQPAITFFKTYGGSDHDEGYCVQQTFDNGYIISGRNSSYALYGYTDITLIKTDSLGDTLWVKYFGGVHSDRGLYVQQTNDSGYIVTGKLGEPDTILMGRGDVIIIKTDKNGDTLWTASWGGEIADIGYSVQQTFDGGYIVAGVLDSKDGGGNDNAFLTKFSSTGDSLWTKTYGFYSVAKSVVQTEDSGYMFTGMTSNPWFPKIYLARTNSIGDTIWTKMLNGGLYGVGNEIIKTSDGNFVITGQIYTGVNWEVFLCKVDLNGSVIWLQSYAESSYEGAQSVDQCFDGGYIMVGARLIRTDANGDTLWTKPYIDEYGYRGACVRQCKDRGFVITGLSGNKPDVFLTKTDSFGNAPIFSNIPKKFEIKNSGFNVFPNPVNRGFYVTYELTENESILFRLFDYTGRELKNFANKLEKKGEHNRYINMENLSAGLYFLVVNVNDKIEAVKVIKY